MPGHRNPLLLCQINTQLEPLGLKVHGTRGAIIDATIITSSARPRNTIDATTEGMIENITLSANADTR